MIPIYWHILAYIGIYWHIGIYALLKRAILVNTRQCGNESGSLVPVAFFHEPFSYSVLVLVFQRSISLTQYCQYFRVVLLSISVTQCQYFRVVLLRYSGGAISLSHTTSAQLFTPFRVRFIFSKRGQKMKTKEKREKMVLT